MTFKKLFSLVLLMLCGTLNVVAQDAVVAGDQITSESSLVSGTEYLVYYVGNGASGYMKDTGSAYTGKNDDTPTEAAVYVFTSNGDDTWTVQNKYTSKYWGTPTANANTYIGSDTGGSWALNFQSSGNIAPSCNGHSWNRSGSNIHPWSTGTANVNQFKIYAVEEITTITATASEVYTINNTNTNRGALIYNPDASTTYVWSSGKSGTFDATAANSQWVLYPTGTDGVYYLYNVGADKFAIPTGIAQSSSNAWVFSDNAVPVTFTKQDDGTYKIQMYTTPVSGTNAAYMAVSNSYTGPIINWNDAGGNFTVTKVDGDQSTAAAAAVARLAGSQTALTAAPTESGWYAVQIKSKSGSTSYAGRYVYNLTSLYNSLYPFGFTGGVDVQPAITDPTYYTYIDVTNGYWQMTDGRYLVLNANNKFPTTAAEPSAVTFGYNGGSYFKSGDYYADPYNSGTNYFIGETTSYRTTYNVYPIDLTTAGLVAWKVVITNASESTQLTCTREDVSGLTAVYNNGTIFLPTDVTPTSSDFSMDGMLSCTIDSENKTITAVYDPSISILASDVTVIQGNETTGKGNTQQALLRVALTPFSDCTLTGVNATITNYGELTNVGAYLTTNDELKYAGTEVTTFSATNSAAASVAMTGSVALTSGTTYYLWITGDVSSSATEWNTIDAAITGITYTNDYTVAQSLDATALDLTEVGDPNGEMRIYSQQAFLWTPSNNETKYYRIPTILRTADDGIIAFTDDRYSSTKDLGSHKIDVVMKKSADNGATWGDEQTIAEGDGSSAAAYGYGDAAVARTAGGKLICIMAAGQTSFPSGMQHVGVSYSSDNGATWTEPTDIYSSIDFGDITPSSVFTTAGKGVTFDNGRVAFAINVKVSGSSTIYEYVLYSDNADEDTPTWQITTTSVYTGADESKLEIMNDNSLLVSVRRGNYNSCADRGYNITTGDASEDGINTWGSDRTWSDMNANGCNADILYYSRSTEDATRPDVILHTLTKQYSTYRKDLRLYMSFDQGATWTEAFQLQPGYAAYSSMQKLANGDLAIIFEDGSIGNVDKGDCYAINYVVISSETLNEKIDELYEESLTPVVTNTAQGSSTGCDSYGSFTGESSSWYTTWTSNDASGTAGVTVVASGNDFGYATAYNQRVMSMRPSAAGATDDITITAPEGYIIDSYTISVRNYSSSQSYKLIDPSGNETTTSTTLTSMTVEDVNAETSTFQFYGDSHTNYLCVTNFTITLRAKFPGYYRIYSNCYDDKYITENLDNSVSTSSASNSYAQIWKIEKDGSTVSLKNVLSGRYLHPTSNTLSEQYQTGTTKETFTLAETDGVYTFEQLSGYGLHCSASQSYNVVLWYTSEAANKWIIEQVALTAEDWAAIEEIQNAQANASSYNTALQTFFDDDACSTLNSTYTGYSDDDLKSAMAAEGLPTALQEMAVCVKNSTWNDEKDDTYNNYEKDFRIHEYDIWSNSTEWKTVTGIGPFARLFHPTGIQATAGSLVYLFVDADVKDSDATLELEMVEGTNQTGSTVTLTKGCNAVYVPTDCELFISYLLNNTEKLCTNYPDIKIHIEGGTCTGFFDMQRGHTDEDWAWLKENMFTGEYLHVRGNSVLLNVITDLVKEETSPVNVMRVWDFIFNTLQSLAGCDQWKTTGQYKMMANCFDNNNDSSNPYWSSYGSSHPTITSDNIFNSTNLRTVGTEGGSVWVISHELGHGHQAPINLSGQKEGSNNSLAQMVNFLTATATDTQGSIFETTRSSRGDGVSGLIDRFNNGYSWIDMGGFRTQSGTYNDVWISNRMLFQLWMYFDMMKNYEPDTNDGFAFMSALYDALRSDPLTKSTDKSNPKAATEDWLKLAKYAAEITQTDLSEFFEVWGFWELEPTVSNTNDDTENKIWYFQDYSNTYIQTAESYVNTVKSDMQAYSTKAPNLMFIEDRCTGSTLATYSGGDASSFGETGYYATFNSGITGTYSYNISGKTITLADATGAVGFKIYDDSDNLVAVANTTTFTVSSAIAEGLAAGTYTLVAAEGIDGEAETIYDAEVEVFPQADTWYTLCTPLRDARYVLSNGAGEGLDGTSASTITDAMQWKFVARDGELNTYDIVNKSDGSYISPDASYNTQLATSSSQPSAGWKIADASTEGLFIIYSGSVQMNQTNSSGTSGYKVYNYGSGSNTTDNGCQFAIEAVTDVSTTVLSEISGYDVQVASDAAESLTAGQWYVMYNRGRSGYLYDNTSSASLYNTATLPTGTTSDVAAYMVRLSDAGDGNYYIQDGFGNYFWRIQSSTNVPVVAQQSEAVSIAAINSTAGHFYVQGLNGSIILDCNGNGSTVVGYGSTVPTSTGGNNDWAFYPVTLTRTVNLKTVGDASYATLYLDNDVIADENTTAYYITEVENGYAQLTPLTNQEIAAKTAVVLVNQAGTTATLTVTNSELEQQVTKNENLLKGTLKAKSLDLSDDTPYYSMGVLNGEIGFYKFDNNGTTTITLGANKAYLEYSAPAGVKGFILDINGSADAVPGIGNSERKSDVFDLSGRRVTNPTRGLYIVNGKKVMIK